MREATICLLTRGEPVKEVLLGYKKVGFGQGKYDGFGGKVEPGETVVQGAARELTEESGLSVPLNQFRRAAHLTFLFPYKPEWSQLVHVFQATQWSGELIESREMLPSWFPIDEIPYEHMWQDSAHWLPRVLAGECVKATFSFCEDLETIEEYKFEEWE